MADEPKRPQKTNYPDPSDEDIMAGDRRISRPDSRLPDWHIPDASYRPIPIVWFAAAFLVQMSALFAIFVLLSGLHGYFTIGVAVLVTAMIGAWTWERGMSRAGPYWKGATLAVLIVQLVLVCFSALPRI